MAVLQATKSLLDLTSVDRDWLSDVLTLSDAPTTPILAGRSGAVVLTKPSLRTRHAAELALQQLGAYVVTEVNPSFFDGERESLEDVARTLDGYHDVILVRHGDDEVLERLSDICASPIINLLSDLAHPTQAVADLLTMQQHFGALDGLQLTYLGDVNNVACSLIDGALVMGVQVTIGTRAPYGPSSETAARWGSAVRTTEDAMHAVRNADVVYTDVWTSMGKKQSAAEREAALTPFRVSELLLQQSSPKAAFMHCLPAHRGLEVDAEVLDGPQSLVWKQASNRLHALRGILQKVML